MLSDIAAVLVALGSLATAAAVFIGFRQLRHAQQNALERFEDDLSREYRQILREIPIEAFYVDGKLELDSAHLGAFYRYFDLSNEQLFHGREKRIRPTTLEDWKVGIAGNLALPVVNEAWRATVERIPPSFFKELRPLARSASEQS